MDWINMDFGAPMIECMGRIALKTLFECEFQ